MGAFKIARIDEKTSKFPSLTRMLKMYNLHKKFLFITKIQSSEVVFRNKSYDMKLSINREWKCNKLQSESMSSSSFKSYKLLSYNILSQDLLIEHLHLYFKIDKSILRWENRVLKIGEEISNIEPDIICLQEVQFNHLKQLIKQISSHHRKWEYVFKKKTGIRSDGCAIIYDIEKFKVISERCVEFYTVGMPNLNRENIAVMAKFQEKNGNALFIVASTHLLYNPRREDVRICQVNKLIDVIIEFSYPTLVISSTDRLPVILTGDFNLTPDTQAFKTLTSLQRASINVENKYTEKQDFQLDAIDFGIYESASTYQHKWIMVDYILRSRAHGDKKSIQVCNIYKLPSLEECLKIGQIPNNNVGSDHFLLAIIFTIS